MNRLALFLFGILINISIAGCNNETSISGDDASGVIEEYLEIKPEYATSSFTFGEITFRGKNDQADLAKYKALEDEGFIKMNLQDQKKRFLAKDSSFVYIVELTDKAAPYVLRQANSKATVKAITYILDDAKPVNFVKVNDNTAKVTVSLKKEETSFYPFHKGKNFSDFMTKTYRLRLKKDEGWEVVN